MANAVSPTAPRAAAMASGWVISTASFKVYNAESPEGTSVLIG